ncbi:MAG: TlpA family protein disulfide reductase, partial [Pedobacter sp.]
SGQELLDRNYFSSFDDLAMSFKGRTVYVDLWATWCVPCKEEFAFNPALKAYLKSKDISILYISMDRDDADKQWKEMMKYYDLTGYHLRVNDALKDDIIYKFYNGKGYSIPRYMLIKDGKIVNDDAMRPSDKEKLYKQIDTLTEAR